MTTYNKARDYLLVALSSIGNDDSMKAIAALRRAAKEKGCGSLIAELESLSRTEFELAAEELAGRQDNADGTDGNYPHMPDGWDNSKSYENNPEDIPKGNSLDNYPSVRVDFLMDGKTGADSGNYSGPELSNKLSYPGVDGNGMEDFDSADTDTAVKDIGEDGLNKVQADTDEKMHGHEEEPAPAGEAVAQNQAGGDPADIGEGFANDNTDGTGMRETDVTALSPRALSSVNTDKTEARADGTAGSGSNSQTFDYAKNGLENNGFDMNDFTAANVELLEDLEDIDDDFSDEDDEILMSPDGDEWDAFILEDDETANLTFDQFPVDMSDKESNEESDEGVPAVTVASEDMPAKIWDRGEEGCSTEEADSDTDGDLNNTEIDEQNAKALDEVFAKLDMLCADTDTSGQEDSLDVAPPVVGKLWYQHAAIEDAGYHADQSCIHLAEAKAARKLYAAARIEGNKEAALIHRAAMNKAERWYKLHHDLHQKLLKEAGSRRAAKALRNLGTL